MLPMINKRNIGAMLAMTITSLAALSSHSYLGSMSRFIADDYCEAYIAQHFGFFRSIWYWYISWDGAFTDSIIDWLLVIIKPGGVPFVTPVLLIIWVVVTAYAIYLFLPQEFSSPIKVLISVAFGSLLVFVTLLISPDVPQSLYWWTGMRTYVLPLVLFTFYLCSFQWMMIKWIKRNIFLLSLISFFIILLTGGLSETFTPVLIMFFIGWVALLILTKKTNSDKRYFFFVLGGMIGALISLILIVIAPGNANRLTLYTPPPGIFGIFNISISAFLAYLSKIIITPEKIAGILGALLASLWLGSFIEHKNQTRPWLPPVILIAGLAFTFGCFLPAAWGLSDAPPDRVLSLPSFILVATILITGFFTGSFLSYHLTPQKHVGVQTGVLVITLACLGFSAWVNIRNLYGSRQPYIDYAQKWDLVNQQIIQAQISGKAKIHIPAMDNWTALDRPRDKSWFWQNVCYSNFYGIQVLGP